jgi:hypothetical protein
MIRLRLFESLVGMCVLLASGGLRAQIVRHASGQNVVPVFEGWERNTDGSFNMVFGYMNRNYEETLDMPVGSDNNVQPGGPDQGQPTHFYRRRQQFVFKVRVPNDWGQKDLVWTLTAHGKTEKAYATLQPISELSNVVYSENRGSPALLTYPPEPNAAPSIEMDGGTERTVAAGKPLELTVAVSDDGHPMPNPHRSSIPSGFVRDSDGTLVSKGSSNGSSIFGQVENPLTQAIVKVEPGVRLGVTWVLYRGGPGTVTFDPIRLAAVEMPSPGSTTPPGPIDGKATTKVTFSAPGTYRLRAYADDSVLVTPMDVIVSVTP